VTTLKFVSENIRVVTVSGVFRPCTPKEFQGCHCFSGYLEHLKPQNPCSQHFTGFQNNVNLEFSSSDTAKNQAKQ